MTTIIVPSFLHEHFGDTLCIISEIERLHNEGNEVWIGDRNVEEVTSRYLDFFNLFKLNWKFRVTGQFNWNCNWRDFSDLYKNPPLIPTYNHDKEKLYKKITYTKDGYWMADQKLNPEWDSLWGSITEIEWIEVNRNINNTLKAQQTIAESDLFIGVDNGVAHMAKSTGTPMILLEHKLLLERGFPKNVVKYETAHTNQEAINLIYKHYFNKFIKKI